VGVGVFNGVFAGAFAAWCVTYLAVGGYFVGAFVARRKDVDLLVFGLLTLSLSLHSAGLGLHYGDPEPTRWAVPHVMANAGALAAAVLGVHFSLLVYGAPWRRNVLRGLYAFAVALLIPLVVSRSWFDLAGATPARMSFMGHDVWVVRAPTLPLGAAFLVLAGVSVVATTALLGLSLRQGKREVAGAFVGALVLCAAVGVDVTGTLRAARWVHVTPHVYVVFALGVAVTLLGRYRKLGDALRDRTRELEGRTDELSALCDELSDARDAVVRSKQLAALGEMAAVVAHEVRNPLAILRNALSSLRKADLSAEDRKTLLHILEEEIDRLNAVVGGLLTYVRPLEPHAEEVDLRDLVQRATAGVVDPRITVEIDPAVDGTWVGDPVLLRRALDNLIENAAHAMTDGGTLSVSVRRENGARPPATLLTVADTGVGMEPEVAERARAPFFTTRATGTGLGLAIVDRIAEAHGGRVDIETAPRQGTRVTLVLPDGAPEPRSRGGTP
jgi:signal transduction histidine kinase